MAASKKKASASELADTLGSVIGGGLVGSIDLWCLLVIFLHRGKRILTDEDVRVLIGALDSYVATLEENGSAAKMIARAKRQLESSIESSPP